MKNNIYWTTIFLLGLFLFVYGMQGVLNGLQGAQVKSKGEVFVPVSETKFSEDEFFSHQRSLVETMRRKNTESLNNAYKNMEDFCGKGNVEYLPEIHYYDVRTFQCHDYSKVELK